MTAMASTAAAVIGGVDTHTDVHVAVACDQLGAALGAQASPTTAAGYRQLLSWLCTLGELTTVGVEGTGSYGVGLTRFLLEHGVELREVSRPQSPDPPASSGKTIRHRLNPGGDRHGNSALWRITIVRMSTDPRTGAYVERRTKEGLSKTEIIRCLKRYVARETYSLLRRELLS